MPGPAVRAEAIQTEWSEVLERLRRPDTGYWDDGTPVVYEGVAAQIVATGPDRFQQVRDQAEALLGDSDARMYGGFAFDEERGGAPWDAWPAAHFILPATEYRRQGDEVVRIDNDVDGWDAAPPPAPAPVPPTTVTDMKGWSDAVARALGAIHDGDATKIVLARCRRAPQADCVDMLHRLRAAEPGTTSFLMRRGPDAFYGATPETLVEVGDRVRTHALAGTAPVGADWLIDSNKDLLEHELVVTYLRGQLERKGALDVRQGRRGLRRLRHVQHLETPLEASIPDCHILDLAEALHPTPAVCGLPPGYSRRLLRALEPFPRGWYTGAVGWFDGHGRGRLDVALRSALATPEATWLFAGAGIVSGSRAEDEWDETTHKLQTFEELLSP